MNIKQDISDRVDSKVYAQMYNKTRWIITSSVYKTVFDKVWSNITGTVSNKLWIYTNSNRHLN